MYNCMKYIYILSKYTMVRKISKKKHKQSFYGNKKKKISIRFFYNFLIFIIVCLGLFLVISIYFSAVDYINRSQIITEKKDMQFMFIDNQWIEHNINQESNEHWSDGKWDYLFKDYSTGEIFSTWIVWTWIVNTWILNTWNFLNTWNKIINSSNLNTWNIKIIDTNKKIITKLDIKNNNINTGSDTPKKDCITPRWKIIESWKSVLAYQQRNDVPDICNIQRRICNDWILWWSFEQKSCKTDMPYTYTKTPVVSYNEKKIDPLIQPNDDVPINKWGNFDTRWQINTSKEEDTIRNNYDNSSIPLLDKNVNQTQNIEPNCISPWWGIVMNGQFVKAYRYKNWFINHPCEVELRPCMQWKLEWTYKNASCKHRDISFEDFMNWYFDKEQPSIQRLIETLNKDIPENEVIIEKWSIWSMFSNLWN